MSRLLHSSTKASSSCSSIRSFGVSKVVRRTSRDNMILGPISHSAMAIVEDVPSVTLEQVTGWDLIDEVKIPLSLLPVLVYPTPRFPAQLVMPVMLEATPSDGQTQVDSTIFLIVTFNSCSLVIETEPLME
ncbi:hypothetical protein FGO68_gene16073 [Halteria grandinella]|uniref:Uncharacterized protein n=1 Tax=Halteria grandinella TaxID=5974 RepID=A0A8J8NAE8_HALGN|nr:hypothetical protein FGO68_gene16073 [Halteria grandinella]